MSPARLHLLALGVVLVTLGGCGGDDEGGAANTATEPTTTAAEAPVATVEVSATDFKFTPANPGVQKTGVVAFELTNDGQATHALEVEGPDGEVETDPLQPGKSQTITADLNKPGRYTWYCPIGDHRERGMDGFVLVAGDRLGGGSGTATDDSGSGGEAGTETESEPGDDNSGSGGDSGSGGSGPDNDDNERDDSGGTKSPY